MEEEVSARVRCYPRDFLRRFGSSGGEAAVEAKEELCELELSLGLSLGGCSVPDNARCFGRSPSTDALSSTFSLGNDVFPATGGPLARACSLPTDVQEEQKKRKELQSLKRMEAKRKRSEKRRPKPGGAEDRKDEVLDEELDDEQRPVAAAGPVNGVLPPLLPVPARAAGVQTMDGSKCFTPETQVSIGSQGSGLSGISDFDCRLKQGFNLSGAKNCSEIKSLSAATLFPKQGNRTPAVDGKSATCVKEEDDGSWKASGRMINGVKKEVERDMMQEMPCVSTRGDGPNGRRIEGFLYKYRKGEEVRIVCVCHGRFFTPAEFVKHAGGGDVAYPLRHIVVNPSPVAFL